MIDLIDDLSSATHVPMVTLRAIADKAYPIIAHGVYEALIEEDDEVVVDVGFGEIIFHLSEDEIKTRFEPSKELENIIKKTVETRADPMIGLLEES